MKDTACLAPECWEPGYSRGLCRAHSVMVNRMLREGVAEANDLISRGLMLERYAGPSCMKGRKYGKSARSIFEKGSKVRGRPPGKGKG